MTLDEQRIAIAESCGWTKLRMTIKGSGAPERRPSPHGYPPGKDYEASVTDYLNDLNAMHEAEQLILESSKPWSSRGQDHEYNRYWAELRDIVGARMREEIVLSGCDAEKIKYDYPKPPALPKGTILLSHHAVRSVHDELLMIRATASQRAKALLKALGKWKD